MQELVDLMVIKDDPYLDPLADLLVYRIRISKIYSNNLSFHFVFLLNFLSYILITTKNDK